MDWSTHWWKLSSESPLNGINESVSIVTYTKDFHSQKTPKFKEILAHQTGRCMKTEQYNDMIKKLVYVRLKVDSLLAKKLEGKQVWWDACVKTSLLIEEPHKDQNQDILHEVQSLMPP